ncbi:MAG: MSHA biogenesis protein MshP [Paraglaciecola sp.]|jgi:MSHA biogenesis protein MshP
MYPRYFIPNNMAKPINQRGSMLVIALFVIIVFGLLGLTMTRLLSSSSETIIHEVLGQRALNASRAGINCAVAKQLGSGCNVLSPFTFVGVPGLENCLFKYEIGETAVQDGSKNFTHWTFNSEGQCTVGNTNVTRNIYVDAMLEVE